MYLSLSDQYSTVRVVVVAVAAAVDSRHGLLDCDCDIDCSVSDRPSLRSKLSTRMTFW